MLRRAVAPNRLAVLLAVALLVVIAPAAYHSAHSSPPLISSRKVPGAIGRVRTPCPWVAVTFDDGPDVALTSAALDVLAAHDARATFYVVGEAVAAHPEVVARVAAAGHEVANHTFTHEDLTGRSRTAVLDELDRTDAALRRAGVDPARQVRPPRGRLDPAAAAWIRSSGWTLVGWSASTDPLLKQGLDARTAAERIGGAVQPGAILLLHDAGPVGARSLSALEPLLAALGARGLEAVTVGELLDSAATGRCRSVERRTTPGD